MRSIGVVLLCAASVAAQDVDALWFEKTRGLPLPERLPRLRRALRETVHPLYRSLAAAELGNDAPRAVAALPELIAAMYDEDLGVRIQAWQAAARFGPAAWQALPVLLELAKEEPQHRFHIERVLAGIRVDGVPPGDFSRDEPWRVQGRAAAAGKLGAAELGGLLEHEHPYVRHHATAALVRLGDTGVAVLAGRVKDPRVRVRRRAVAALAELARRTDRALPPLVRALEDDDAPTQQAAIRGLGASPKGAEHIRAFVAKTKEPTVLRAALDAWEGAQPGASHEYLRTALDSDDASRRRLAAQKAGDLGAAAAPLVPALAQALFDEEVLVRDAARAALVRIPLDTLRGVAELKEMQGLLVFLHRPGEAPPVAPPPRAKANATRAQLLLVLDGDDWIAAAQAATFLSQRRPPSQKDVPSLVRALSHGHPYVRARAARALGAYGEAAVPALLEALAGDARVRKRALDALGALGPAASPAIPALVELIETDVRAAATLGGIGPKAAVAVPALIAMAEEGDDARSLPAIRALGALGPTARAAVPALTRFLDHPARSHAAAGALGKLGEAAASAVPALVRVAQAAPGARAFFLQALAAVGEPGHRGLRDVMKTANAADHLFLFDRIRRDGLASRPLLDLARAAAAGHADPRVRARATQLLDQLQRPEDLDVAELVAALGRGTVKFDGMAAALARKADAPELLALLEVATGDALRGVITALGTKGTKAESALPRLKTVLRTGEGAPLRLAALAATASIAGKKAQPTLLDALGAEQPPRVTRAIERKLAQWGDQPALARALHYPEPLVRQSAAVALRELVPLQKGVVKDVFKAFSTRDLFVPQLNGLLRAMGEAAVPGLLDALRRTGRAERLLVRLGPTVVPRLIAALKDHDPGYRTRVLNVVAAFDELGLPELMRAAKQDPYGGVRAHALTLLARRGSQHAAILKTAAKEDRDPQVQQAAMGQLQQIQRIEKEWMPSFLLGLRDPATRNRTIGRMQQLRDRAYWPLRQNLKTSDPALRDGVAIALAELGAPDVEALRVVLRESKHLPTRRRAAAALERVGERAAPALPELEIAFDQPDTELRSAALRALGAVGPAARSMVDEVFPRIDEFDRRTRESALFALARIDTTGGTLVRLWQRADAPLRQQLLAAAGNEAPALAGALRAGDEQLRARAADQLRRIGRRAVDVVTPLLKDRNALVRAQAAATLGRIGPGAHPAVTALTRLLRDVNADVRTAAAHALGEIGHGALSALSALEALSSDDDHRAVALEAIDSLRGHR